MLFNSICHGQIGIINIPFYVSNGEVAPIPKIVYNTMNKKFIKPEINEGFENIDIVLPNFIGNDIYNMYFF